MMMTTTTATSSSFLRPVTFLSSSFSKDGVVCRRKTYRCFDTIRDAKTKKKRNYDARVAASTSSSGGVSWEDGKKSGANNNNNKAITNPDAYKVLSVIRKRAGDYVDTKRVVGVPSSVFHMAERHFVAELKALFREHVLDKKDILAKEEERTALTEFHYRRRTTHP